MGFLLAIELAAARMKVLAVEQIVARLDDRSGLLTGGGQTTVPRHRELLAAMDWSYDLLRRMGAAASALGVFRRRTLEAIEAVCAGSSIEAAKILDLPTQLVDKSLVQVEIQEGEARYRSLETVQEYGSCPIVASTDAASP